MTDMIKCQKFCGGNLGEFREKDLLTENTCRKTGLLYYQRESKL